MSGFEAHLGGGYALTVSAAMRWLGEGGRLRLTEVFDLVRERLATTSLEVVEHPRTDGALVVSGGHCLPLGCTAEVFEALRPGGRGHHAGACERSPRLDGRVADGVPRRG